jgi:hypothetical protein
VSSIDPYKKETLPRGGSGRGPEEEEEEEEEEKKKKSSTVKKGDCTKCVPQ